MYYWYLFKTDGEILRIFPAGGGAAGGQKVRARKHFMAPRTRDDGCDPNDSVYEIGTDLWAETLLAVNVSEFIMRARSSYWQRLRRKFFVTKKFQAFHRYPFYDYRLKYSVLRAKNRLCRRQETPECTRMIIIIILSQRPAARGV